MFSIDNRIQAGVYWTSEVKMMIDKDMLEAIGLLMDSKLEPIKADITKINVTLENDVNKKIELLLEGQQGMNEKFSKLDQVAEDVEEIKIKVSALEEVSRSQASQIREIRLAK